MICGDLNQTKRVEDSVGPSPLLHGSKHRAWNCLMDKMDLLDNMLIVVLKIDSQFTLQAAHGNRLDQSRID